MWSTIILVVGIVMLVGGFVRNMFATYQPPHHHAPGAPPPAHPESNSGFWVATVCMLLGLTMILSVSVKPAKLAAFQAWAHAEAGVVGAVLPPVSQVPNPPDITKVVYDRAARTLVYPAVDVPGGWEFGGRAIAKAGTSGTNPILVPPGELKMEIFFRKTGASDLTAGVVIDTPL